MAKRDDIHYSVCRALERDNWKILADPFILKVLGVKFEVDLEAEKWVGVEKENLHILIEIKSLTNYSVVHEFSKAFGQYQFYRDGVNDLGLDVEVYMAISIVAYKRIIQIPFFVKRIAQYGIKFIIIDLHNEKIVEWIS